MLQLKCREGLEYHILEYEKQHLYAHAFVTKQLNVHFEVKNKEFYVFVPDDSSQITQKICKATDVILNGEKSIKTSLDKIPISLENLVEKLLFFLDVRFKIHPFIFKPEKLELIDKVYQDKDFYYLFQDLSFSKYFNTIPNYMVHYVESKTKAKLNNGLFKINCISDLLASKEEKPSDLVPSAYLYQ